MIVDRALEVLRDRTHRQRMADADYWDDRVRSRTGNARSVWHAASFNDAWNRRQVHVLDTAFGQLLGGVRGRDVLDVGCGTGRITLELQLMGAKAVGVDFSAAAVDAAAAEASSIGTDVRYVVGDIAQPPLPFDDGSFDVAVAVGCLAVACRDLASLERSLREMARVTRKTGAVVLLEPVHASKLLGRVLRAPVSAWVDVAQRAGLRLVVRQGMGFVPVRLALSSFDLPPWVVRPIFGAGEAALDSVSPKRLADYTLLGFHRTDR